MRIAVVEPAARGGLIHYAFMLCRELVRTGEDEGVEVTLITGRGYELADLPHSFRVEPILRLWDPKPSRVRDRPGASLPGTGSRSEGRRNGCSRLGSGSPRDAQDGGAVLRGLASDASGRGAPGRSRAARRWLWWRRVGRAFVWYREWVRLALHLRRLAPDVVQLGDIRFPGDLAALWLLRALGLRLADVCHNVEPFAGGSFGRTGLLAGLRRAIVRGIYRRIYRCFEVVFVHHRINRATFLRLYGLPPERVREIPLGNGALFEELRQRAAEPQDAGALRRRLGLPENAAGAAPVVLLFGTLSRYKGADLLLEAFARLGASEAGRDAGSTGCPRLVLAGYPLAGFDPEALRQRACSLGVGDAVTVAPGYVPSEEVAAWMELATVAVFPYREIYQSAALQVALTFGVPTVASRVGAVPEVVRDGETGLLVPPGDVDALAAAIERLLERPDLARALGERAAADQRRRFAWSRVACRVLASYRTLPGPRDDESTEEGVA